MSLFFQMEDGDPFLGGSMDATQGPEFHSRQESADSGLGLGTAHLLPSTPEDFLSTMDDNMDTISGPYHEYFLPLQDTACCTSSSNTSNDDDHNNNGTSPPAGERLLSCSSSNENGNNIINTDNYFAYNLISNTNGHDTSASSVLLLNNNCYYFPPLVTGNSGEPEALLYSDSSISRRNSQYAEENEEY